MNKEEQFISESKMRCKDFGLNSYAMPTFSTLLSEKELLELRAHYTEILPVIGFFVQKMLELMKGIPILLLISDQNGCILEMAGDESIKNVVIDSGINVGLVFKEEDAGTNSIDLALRHRQPIQIVGPNHYCRFLESTVCYTSPFQYPDGEDILGTITLMTTIDQHNPFLLAMLSTVVDSIERELLLKKQNRRLNLLNQIVIETTQNGVIVTDKDGNITEYNQFAEKFTNMNKQDVLHKPLPNKQMAQFVHEVLTNGTKYQNVELVMSHQGTSEQSVCLFDASPIYDEQLQVLGAVAQFRDITERYRAQEKINYLVYHDDLTGLYNRRFFVKHLKNILEENKQDELAILFLDLDHFKNINDRLGHNNGDHLLTIVGHRLRDCLSAMDVVARMGGDEFTILLTHFSSIDEVSRTAEKVIDAFKKPFRIDGYEFFMTTSIGIALYPYGGDAVETLLKHADTAMYQAKELGKNTYAFFRQSNENESEGIVY